MLLVSPIQQPQYRPSCISGAQDCWQVQNINGPAVLWLGAKLKAKLFVLIASLVVFGAVPSQATTVYITYTGTVSGTDRLGLFGTPGANITGAQYKADYVFDVTFGLSNSNLNSPTWNYIQGGSAYSSPSPNIGATFTIGSTSLSLVGSAIGEIYGLNQGGVNGTTEQMHYAHDGVNILQNVIYNFSGSSSGLPASITTAFSYTVVPGDTAYGVFDYPYSGETLNLTPITLTESLTAPATTPIPAALPLFATGLGALGLLGWRRKRKAAALAAT
jgi:hypothetical protein